MKRIAVGLALIAAGFIGGLLAQQPQFGGRGPGGPGGFGGFIGRMPFAAGTVSQVQGNTIVVEASFGEQTFHQNGCPDKSNPRSKEPTGHEG
jgi:hypothetical protein